MVAIAPALDRPGLRLTATELLSLRPDAAPRHRHRPATRRAGALPAKPPGSGMDLRDLRAWVEGDDPRRIDPSATARTGIPHIRSFHEDRDDTTLLIADFRRSMLWGTGTTLRSVAAARHLTGIGWQAVLGGGNVAALALTDAGAAGIPASAGERQMTRLAHLFAGEHDLALSRSGAATAGLAALAGRAAAMVSPGSRIHLATSPHGIAGSDMAPLARLARRRRLQIALIVDPAEAAPPDQALSVSDGDAFRFGRLSVLDVGPLRAQLHAIGAEVEEVLA